MWWRTDVLQPRLAKDWLAVQHAFAPGLRVDALVAINRQRREWAPAFVVIAGVRETRSRNAPQSQHLCAWRSHGRRRSSVPNSSGTTWPERRLFDTLGAGAATGAATNPPDSRSRDRVIGTRRAGAGHS